MVIHKSNFFRQTYSIIFSLLISLLTLAPNAQAAIEIELEKAGNVIRALAVSDKEFAQLLNMTTSAKVSLRVSSGTTFVKTATGQGKDVVNLNGTWSLSRQSYLPLENSSLDYLSIGLTSLGTTVINYLANMLMTLVDIDVANCIGIFKSRDWYLIQFPYSSKCNTMNSRFKSFRVMGLIDKESNL